MNFRKSLQKPEWNCETNMFSDIDQATRLTTLAGENSRSSYAPPKGFRLLASIRRPDTTRPATEFFRSLIFSLRRFPLFICAAAVFAPTAFPQIAVPPPPPPAQEPTAGKPCFSSKL